MRRKKGMGLRTKEALTGLAFALPCLIGLLAFFAVPFLLSIRMSINTVNLDATPWYTYYASVFSSTAFQLALSNTLRFIAIGVPLIIIIELFMAIGLFRSTALTSFMRSAFVLPLVVPIASVILVFQAFFMDKGYINAFLTALHIAPVMWLSSSNAFYVLLIIYIWKNCGYGMVLFIAGLSGISKEYYEAGRIDGANERQLLFHITIPQLMPTFSFVLFISIINSFKVFREAYILSGAYPDKSIYMIQHFMNNNFQNLNYQRLSVSSVAVFLIVLMLMLLIFLYRKKDGDL